MTSGIIAIGYDIEGRRTAIEWGDPDPAGWRRCKVKDKNEIATTQRGHRCDVCGLPAAVSCSHPATLTVHRCMRHALGVSL